jgi:phage tail sheath protein FI
MGKVLKPTLEKYIEEPLDLPLFRDIYYVVKPELDSWVTKRAAFTVNWYGDQNASTMADLQINNPTDVQLGKYQVQLAVSVISPLQELTLNITLTKAGVQIS